MAKKVGILGPLLTYTHQAALVYYSGRDVEIIPYATIDAVLWNVEAGKVEEGVVPEENVIEGTVRATIDGYCNSSVHLAGKTVLPINHCLGVHPDTRLEDIKEVWTKAEAFSQCSRWIKANMPDALLVPQNSTAYAAEKIMKDAAMQAAAIAPEIALTGYNLKVVATNIGNVQGNKTMFGVVGVSLNDRPSGDDETTIIIHPNQNYPGQLVAYLRCFSDRGINLTRIESRPGIKSRTPSDSRGERMTYLFPISLKGHYLEDNVRASLRALQEICLSEGTSVKLVGSYPKVELYNGH